MTRTAEEKKAHLESLGWQVKVYLGVPYFIDPRGHKKQITLATAWKREMARQAGPDVGHENDAGPLFAVGTRVRVIDYRRIHKGLIGVVREIKEGPEFIVDMEIKGNGSGVFNAAELERA